LIETGFEDGSYRVALRAVLDAPAEAVATVLTDFAHYHELDPRIRASEVLATSDTGEVLLHTRLEVCAGYFCRTVDRVERVTRGRTSLRAEVLPDRSDLRRGITQTRWRPAQARTRVQYSAEFEPGFWVPAFIGRGYSLRVLRESTLRLFANVEDRARHL
jgi:hypothetical protein